MIPMHTMSCFSALPQQMYAVFSMPQDILLLKHNVYIEYAKIAVSQDFIHTFPTILIFWSTIVMFWKNPPAVQVTKISLFKKAIQISTSWIFISTFVWLWLVFQQIVYCNMWIYWSQESEYRDIKLPWWQQVWYPYFPESLNPPILSSSFLSWLICMVFSSTLLVCAFSVSHIKNYLILSTGCALESLGNAHHGYWIAAILNKILVGEPDESFDPGDKSEWSSLSDLNSELGSGDMPNGRAIYPIPMTTRGRKPTKSPEYVKAYETFSGNSSSRTSTANIDISKNERGDEQNGFTPMQLRQQRSTN